MDRNDYYRIVAEIKKRREIGDAAGVRRWLKKLENWQRWYGAYAPIK